LSTKKYIGCIDGKQVLTYKVYSKKRAQGKVTEGKYLARLFENFARNSSKYEASPSKKQQLNLNILPL